MTELQESSVLFSLNQLMNLEQQRLREEEEAARARSLAEGAARRLAEQRAREEEEARIRAEASRRRTEEVQRREVEARLDAIRMAELEKVRIEAEQRQRIALMEQANEHERKLTALRQDRQKKRLVRILVIGGALMSAALTAGLGVYFGHIKPEADRLHQQELADLAAREAELKKLRADYEAALAKSERAAVELAQAKDASDRIRAQQTADDATKAADDARKRLQTGPVKKIKDPGCKCADPNDPLCGCLN